jgi:hypothetical protein
LQRAIIDALPYHEATLISETVFGKKYEVVVPLRGANGRTVNVTTIWQFDRLQDEERFADAPRLVTLYIP